MKAAIHRALKILCENATIVAFDFIAGRRFWTAVLGVLIPTIVAAVAVSSHGSRLTVTLEVEGPSYKITNDSGQIDGSYRDRLAAGVNELLKERLEVAMFPGKPPPAAEAAPPPSENRARESLLSYLLPTAVFKVKSKVTNIGQRPSSLSMIVYYAVEELDGNRHTLDVLFRSGNDLSLPEGQPETIGNPNGGRC